MGMALSAMAQGREQYFRTLFAKAIKDFPQCLQLYPDSGFSSDFGIGSLYLFTHATRCMQHVVKTSASNSIYCVYWSGILDF